MNRSYRAQAVKLHKERLAKAQQPRQLHYNGKGEAEVCPGLQLSAVLRHWVVEHLADRPSKDTSKNGKRKFVSPHIWLADQTGINVRRVSGIINGEFPAVPLSQADALLQAIEQTDALGKEVDVIPNPNWSPERWYEYMAERGCI